VIALAVLGLVLGLLRRRKSRGVAVRFGIQL
jgi:hypothetical protein